MNIEIQHTNYKSVFDTEKFYPIVVNWTLTKDHLDEARIPRVNDFSKDPLFPSQTNLEHYYQDNGQDIDRGHMCPCEDNLTQGSGVEAECFYFSNMAPQYHHLNIGSWKKLEGECRKWADEFGSIDIWAGSIGEIGKMGAVSIPEKCWKVVHIPSTDTWGAYIFQNTKDDSGNLEPESTVEIIVNLTGLKF